MLNALWMVLGGMAIVFAVLGLLLLMMVIIKKVFRPESENTKGGG